MEALAKRRGFKTTKLLTKAGTRSKVLAAVKSAAPALTAGDIFFLLFRWRSKKGEPVSTVGNDRDDGVWPEDFQNPDFYTRAGSIGRFDPAPWESPLDPRNEFRRGDFFSLKEFRVQESALFAC